MSISTKSAVGPVIETNVLWSQSFPSDLQLSLASTPMPIEPPILLLTATCGELSQHFLVDERGKSDYTFVVNPSPIDGITFYISFSNWKYGSNGETTVHLTIVEVANLAIAQLFNGNIQFPN